MLASCSGLSGLIGLNLNVAALFRESCVLDLFYNLLSSFSSYSCYFVKVRNTALWFYFFRLGGSVLLTFGNVYVVDV